MNSFPSGGPFRPAEHNFYHHKGNFHQNARIWGLKREAVCTTHSTNKRYMPAVVGLKLCCGSTYTMPQKIVSK